MVRHTGEDFIDEECVAVSSVLSLQTPCIFGTEFNTPQSDGIIADGDTSFGKEIFNVTMAVVETIMEPDGITDDVGWKSVTLVCIHRPILSNETSVFVSTLRSANLLKAVLHRAGSITFSVYPWVSLMPSSVSYTQLLHKLKRYRI